jgi:copper(I)-binding protein
MQRTYKLITLLLCIFSTSAATAMDISIEKPWVRSGPPTAEVFAAYMIIHNHSAHSKTLTSLASTDFEAVSLHQTSMHEGMMHMKTISSLDIGAGQSISLEPGGYHLMLSKPMTPISNNKHIKITLTFDDGKTLVIEAPIKDRQENDDADSHNGGHHH